MIDIDKLLTELGIEHRNAGPSNYKTICLNPNHDETAPSMNIHKDSGIIHCFGCGLKGNVFTLLRYKGITGGDAIAYLQRFASGGHTEEDVRKALEEFLKSRGEAREEEEETVKYSEVELPPHRMIDSNIYLESRGITQEEILKWNMAVVTKGKQLGWVLIPIYQNGLLRNYFMRDTIGSGKLYANIPRSGLLAGIDFADNYTKPIAVTEGIFDAIFVARAGFQAVACLSNVLLPPQLDILKRYSEVAIVPDTDKMGLRLVESAGSLIYHTDVSVLALPDHRKDAAECTVLELLNASKNRMPWNTYMIGKKFG